MADENAATGDQASQGDEQNETTTTAQESQTEGETQETQEEQFDQARAMATIQKLRGIEREHKVAQKELTALRKAQKEADDAKLSEQERLTKRTADLEAELATERKSMRERDNQHAVERAAQKIGIVDPEAAVKLMDWSEIEYDAEGRPQDVEGALNRLLEARPYLKAQQQQRGANNSATNAGRAQAPGQRRYTSEEIADRAFYVANQADIELAFRQNRIDS